jgi:undecaprenyl pyrophosphate phosphatase UppP
MLVAFIATFVVAITKTGFLGLAQRASLAIFVIWVIVVAARMLIVAGGEG